MTRKDNWYLSVSDLRRALNFTHSGNVFGKFSVVVWRSRHYIYNDQTQNIIAVIGAPNPGQPAVLRYRPRSWYAPILEQWAIKHDYIPLASSNVGRRHRRIMRIVPTLSRPSRETINSRIRVELMVPGTKTFRDPFLKMLSKDHRSDEPDEIEIDAHDLNLFPPLAASASGVIDEASINHVIQSMSESEQAYTISPSTSISAYDARYYYNAAQENTNGTITPRDQEQTPQPGLIISTGNVRTVSMETLRTTLDGNLSTTERIIVEDEIYRRSHN